MAPQRFSPAFQVARLRSFAKRNGPPWLQRRIWDWEFKAGKWDYLERADDPELFGILTERLSGGALLDLGCGNGVVRCGLPTGTFRRYVGVDLADEAIRRLEARTSGLGPLPGGQLLIAGDFADDDVLRQVGSGFDVVLLHDSIYYVDDVVQFLRRVSSLLTSDGVVVVRIHDRHRYSRFVEDTRAGLDIVDEPAEPTARHIILVGRPPQDG